MERKLKTKVAIFDFDGTLTSAKPGENCCRYVWERIGKADRDDQLYGQFLQGNLDREEFSNKVIEEYIDSQVTYSLIEDIAKGIVIREGIEETFSYLKTNGVRIYILSGGIKQMIEFCLDKTLKFVDEIECDSYVFNKDGVIEGSVKSEYDTLDKFSFVNEMAEKLNILPDEIFFMGNGKNDETAHKSGAITLCVNPDNTNPNDKNCWDFYIEDIKSLTEIIPFIK